MRRPRAFGRSAGSRQSIRCNPQVRRPSAQRGLLMRGFRRITRIALATTIVASGMTVVAADAQGASIGVSVRGVRIAEVYFDSPGPDNVSNKSLNGEWVK